jgi:hypothetical protein
VEHTTVNDEFCLARKENWALVRWLPLEPLSVKVPIPFSTVAWLLTMPWARLKLASRLRDLYELASKRAARMSSGKLAMYSRLKKKSC